MDLVERAALAECGTFVCTPDSVKLPYACMEQMLLEPVRVQRVLLAERLECGVRVKFETAFDMVRLHFLEHMLVWLEALVFQKCQVPVLGSRTKRTSRESVEGAIKGLSTVCRSQILCEFKRHIFQGGAKVGSLLCYYASSIPIDECHSVFKSAHHKLTTNELYYNAIYNKDVLQFVSNADGITWYKPWVYSGGGCMAGHHVEDAFLHFVHVCLSVDWELCLVSPQDPPECPQWTLDERVHAAAVLKATENAACKSWLFGKNVGSIEGLQRLMSVLVELGCDSREEGGGSWEHALWARDLVLNPEFMCNKYPNLFVEVEMNPGSMVLSNESHSVCGFSSLCMAWNVGLYSHILQYARLEQGMARQTRLFMKARTANSVALRGETLPFCFTTECMTAFDVLAGSRYKHCTYHRLLTEEGAALVNMRIGLLEPFAQFCWGAYSSQYSNTPQVCKEAMATSVVSHGLVQNDSQLMCCMCGEPLVYRALLAAWSKTKSTKWTHLFCSECFACIAHNEDVHHSAYADIRSPYSCYWHTFTK